MCGFRERIDRDAERLLAHLRVLECAMQIRTDDARRAGAVATAIVETRERLQRGVDGRASEVNLVGPEWPASSSPGGPHHGRLRRQQNGIRWQQSETFCGRLGRFG